MKRATIALFALAVAMCAAAVLRASVLRSDRLLLAREPIPAATPIAMAAATAPQTALWPRPLFHRPGSVLSSDAADDKLTTSSTGPNIQLPRLIGVIINQKNRIAVFGYDGTLHRVGENQKIGDWILTRIDRRSATLQSESASRLLKLDPGAP